MDRALGSEVWGRKAARLPQHGTLLVATDLQGNLADYRALKALYRAELEANNDPILAICGDLVHGPAPELNVPGCWPEYLGTEYHDESRDLIVDFEEFTRTARAFSLLGNHEHAHIGGPIVSKFHPDEAGVLDEALGDARPRIHEFIRSFPLIAVAPCGVVLTHGAPAASEPSLESFESLSYNGYEALGPARMYAQDTVGRLLWSRMASTEQAEALLNAVKPGGRSGGFVAFGHDVVHEGFVNFGPRQICVSTSYGLRNENKAYLRLDLSERYESVDDLREGHEIRRLYE